MNLKELEPTKKSIRARLSKYGERAGKIFETVLFELNNPEDIVNHILKEEKGRNMLLSNEMKFIGIYCDLIDTNLLCTIIDIVQDFSPFRDNKENNNMSNINNNIRMTYNNIDNNNYNFNKSNFMKQNYFYNQSNYSNINTEYISLTQNLNNNNKISKDNLKLKILPRKKPGDLPMNIRMDINLNDNYNLTNNNLNKKTPKKIQYFDYKNSNGIFSPTQFNLNNLNIKKVTPKRINTSNIKNILNEEEKGDSNNLVNIKDIRFTMAGRSDSEQQNIIEISKKNMNKSKSVSSFDGTSVNSKNSGKNKFQRLNHDEKMAILHKINNRQMKSSNSKSPSNKNFQNNNFIMKDDNNTKISPSKISSMDYNSEIEKIEVSSNNYVEFIRKETNNNIDKENNQIKFDLRSLKGDIKMVNNDYTNKKIYEIKSDIKNQLKEEIKKEVRDEIKNEFNKQLLYEKKQIVTPIKYNYDMVNNINNKIQRNYSNKNIITNNCIYGKDNNKNQNNYVNKKIYYNKYKGRWSSVGKYYYNKNNNDQDSTSSKNSNKLYFPNKKTVYKKNNNIYYKERKSYDLRELTSNNKINDGIILKQKNQERYTKSNYPVNRTISEYNII